MFLRILKNILFKSKFEDVGPEAEKVGEQGFISQYINTKIKTNID